MTQVLYRIAQLDDVESVFSYESSKMHDPSLGEIENQILIWDSHFRKESLEHYFKLGWSFLALDPQNKVVGFFMGQPLLFVDKQTQSLWIEYVSADNADIFTELVDIAYRLSREKHFQRVLLSDSVQKSNLKKDFPFKDLERDIVYLKTTK
jgi:hypothetical protein